MNDSIEKSCLCPDGLCDACNQVKNELENWRKGFTKRHMMCLTQCAREHEPNEKETEAERLMDRMIEQFQIVQMERLRNTIRFHAHLYYNLDKPEITDAEYDYIYKRLQKMEKDHPKLVTPDSPTQLVGGAISEPLRGGR